MAHLSNANVDLTVPADAIRYPMGRESIESVLREADDREEYHEWLARMESEFDPSEYVPSDEADMYAGQEYDDMAEFFGGE